MSKSGKSEQTQRDRLARLAVMPDETIDTSDISELSAETWATAEIGRFYRPKKEAVTIRLDADILEYFRRSAEGGRGYQTAINAALRSHMTRKI